MQLRGKGEVRYLGLIKVYDAYLYLPDRISSDQALSNETSRCLLLEYNISLSVDNFIQAADKVLARQHEQKRIDQVSEQLNRLNRSYRDVSEDDSYLLCYDSGSRSTSLQLNGELLVTIESALFAEIYFGIWLGDRSPIDKGLKNNLLAMNQNGVRQ
jgi:hypothetical protein